MCVCVCVCVCVGVEGSRWPKGDMWYTHCYASSNKHQWFFMHKEGEGREGTVEGKHKRNLWEA